MSNARFDLIDYATVPASAMHIYRHAFARRDGERYYKYLHSLEKPVLGEIEQAPDITEEVMMEILSSERLAPIYKALGVKK